MVGRVTSYRTLAWAVSFRYRDFRWLWVSILIYSVGNGMEQVAVGWLVFEMTGSAFMVGVAAAARMAPLFFLGIVSGTLSDRLERKAFLRLVTFPVRGRRGRDGRADPGYQHQRVGPAGPGCRPWLRVRLRTDHPPGLYGGHRGAEAGAQRSGVGLLRHAGRRRVAGSAVSGVLIEEWGAGWQYVAVTAWYVVAGLTLFAVRTSQPAIQGMRQSAFRNLVGSIRLLRRNRSLLVLMGLTSITEVFGFSHMTLLPILAKDVIDVGPAGLGVMTAVRQGGGLIGLVMLASLVDYRRKGLLMFLTAGLFGLAQVGPLPVRQSLRLPGGAGRRQCRGARRRHAVQDPHAGRGC